MAKLTLEEAKQRATKAYLERELSTYHLAAQKLNSYGSDYLTSWRDQGSLNGFYDSLERVNQKSKMYQSYVQMYGTDDQKAQLEKITSAIDNNTQLLFQKDDVLSFYGNFENEDSFQQYLGELAWYETTDEAQLRAEKASSDARLEELSKDVKSMNFQGSRYTWNDDAYNEELKRNEQIQKDIEKLVHYKTGKAHQQQIDTLIQQNASIDSLFNMSYAVDDESYSRISGRSFNDYDVVMARMEAGYRIDEAAKIGGTGAYDDIGLNKYMEDDERLLWMHYANQDKELGTNDAQAYWDYLLPTLLARQQGNFEEFGKKYPIVGSIASILAVPVSAIEYVGDLGDSLFDGKAKINTTSNFITGTRSGVSDLIGNGGGSFLYNTGMSMVDSALAALIPGGAGAAVLGASAAASTQNDILMRGGTDAQAFAGGLAAGIFEGFFERFSIGQLQNMKPKEIVASWKAFGDAVGKSAFTNATEEAATEFANIVADEVIMGSLSNYSNMIQQYIAQGMTEDEARRKACGQLAGQVMEAGASGALMGLGFGLLGGAVGVGQSTKAGKRIIMADTSKHQMTTEELLEGAEGLFVGKEYAEQQKLIKDIKANLDQNDKAQQLRLGELEKAYFSEVQKKGGAKVDAKTIQKSALEHLDKTIEAVEENAAGVKVDPDHATITEQTRPQIVSYAGMTSEDILVKPEGGATVRLADSSVSDVDLAEIYEYAITTGSLQAANDFVQNWDGSDPKRYWMDWTLFQNAGYNGSTVEAFQKAQQRYNGSSIHDTVQLKAFQSGSMQWAKEAKSRSEAASKLIAEYREKLGNGEGRTKATFDDSEVANKNLARKQKELVRYLRAFGEALSVNIKIVAADGKRIINGSYNRTTNTIKIDINAGISQNATFEAIHSAVINTLSHESVHWMAVNAPEQYAVLRDLVLDFLYDDDHYDLDDAIEKQMEKRAETKTRPAAIEEIVARACEDILGNSQQMKDFLAELYKRDQTTFERFTEAVKEIFQTLKKLMENLVDIFAHRSGTLEAAAIRRLGAEQLSALENAFMDSVKAAPEASAARNKSVIKSDLTHNEQYNDKTNHIYSITNKKEEAPTKGVSGPVGHRIQNASSTDSISDSDQKSNTFSEKNLAAEQESFIKKYLGDLYDDMEQFSINEEFEAAFDAWDGKDTNTVFTVGRTSDVLKSIGMRDQEIILRSGTVTQKLKKHPEMTRDIFKKIPYLLENPVIVQFSDAIDPKTGKPKFDSRITVLGELYATMEADGVKEEKPVLVSMELLPTNRSGNAILDFSVITSAYGHSKLQKYLDDNSILYIDPDKKRTKSWLSLNRLQLPLGENKLGSVRSITYSGGKVKIENSKNKNSMQAALERAGIVDSYGNSIWQDEQNDAQLEAEEVFSAVEDSELSIKEQLKHNLTVISALAPVANVTYTSMNKKMLHERISEQFRKIGYKVDRQNFGIIEIGEKQIDKSLNYVNTEGEKAAFFAIPSVLKRGIEISGHTNHKRREYNTVTIAAKVLVNGEPGIVAAVVTKIDKKNKYRVHRVLTPDGSQFVLSDKQRDAESTSDEPLSKNNKRASIESASKNSISNSEQKSNTFSEISSDEIHSYADDAVLSRDPSDILRGIISQLVDPKAKKNDPNASEKDGLKQYGKYHRSLKIYQEMQRTVERNQARIEQYDSDVVKLLRSNDYVRSINQKRKRLAEIDEDLKGDHLSQTERDALGTSKNRIEKSIQKLEKDLAELKLITENYGADTDVEALLSKQSTPLQDLGRIYNNRRMAERRISEAKAKMFELEAKDLARLIQDERNRLYAESMRMKRDTEVDMRETYAKRDLRAKIVKTTKELKKLFLEDSKEKHIKQWLKETAAATLLAVDTDDTDLANRMEKLKKKIDSTNAERYPFKVEVMQAEYDDMKERADRIAGEMRAIQIIYDSLTSEQAKKEDPLLAGVYDRNIAEAIRSCVQEIGDTPMRKMTVKQLEQVYTLHRMVLTTIKNANHAFKAGQGENISDLGTSVMEEIKEVGKERDKIATVKAMLDGYKWNSMTPIYAMRAIGSKTFSMLFDNLLVGQNVYGSDLQRAKNFVASMMNKYGYNQWDFKKKFKVTSTTGKEFELTLGQVMQLYGYSGRPQADRHLLQGGFVLPDDVTVVERKKGVPVKYKVNKKNACTMNKKMLEDLIAELTEEQKAYVDELIRYNSTVLSKDGNEVSLELYGVKLFNDPHYISIESADDFTPEASKELGDKPAVRLKNSGMTKKTNRNANNPIVLREFDDAWAKHVNQMAVYHGMTLPLEDFHRVFNYQMSEELQESGKDSVVNERNSVKTVMKNAYGEAPAVYIANLIEQINGGVRVDHMEDNISKRISMYKRAATTLSASVIIQQPTAVMRAMAYISPKYFVGKKPGKAQGSHKERWEELKKYASIAVIKEMGGFDTGIGMGTSAWILGKEYEGLKQKAKAVVSDQDYRNELITHMPAFADECGWLSIWEAVKREVADTAGLQIDTDEFFNACGERFTEVINLTQVYDSVLSRSAFMRSKSAAMKMVTAFMAEPTLFLNMVMDAFLTAKRGDKKTACRVIGSCVTSMLFNAALVSLVYAARDDDEDETYGEKYLYSFSVELIEGLTPFNYMPIIRDIWSLMLGWDVERSDMALFEDVVDGINGLFSEKKKPWRKYEDFVGSIANLFGIPFKNLSREFRSIWNLVKMTTGLIESGEVASDSFAEILLDAADDTIPYHEKIRKINK